MLGGYRLGGVWVGLLSAASAAHAAGNGGGVNHSGIPEAAAMFLVGAGLIAVYFGLKQARKQRD